MIRRYRNCQQLSAHEKLFTLRVAILMPVFWLGLRLAGFRKMLQLVQRQQPGLSNGGPQHAQRYAELTSKVAAHILPDGSCLAQALTLCFVLRRKGLNAIVNIGATRASPALSAHAWVSVDGLSLDNNIDRYQKLI